MLALPWLGGEGTGAFTKDILWQGYEAVWPTHGPDELGGPFATIPAFGVPFLNTLILLTSGVTVTMAHHAMKKDHRGKLVAWLLATVALGFIFVYFQIEEYMEAYQHLGLTLGSGIYGEATLAYTSGTFRPYDYTYPDYRWPETLEFFAAVRARYLEQKRTMGPWDHGTRRKTIGP